ncbi:MAG: heavy metal translocating P-type ATPase, partial [Polyangiaceae bacterium]
MEPAEPTGESLLLTPAVARAPRSSAPAGARDEDDHGQPALRGDLVRIALVAGAVAASWFFPWKPWGRIDVVALGATLLGGYPIFKEAFGALRERRMTMELSMSIALVAALTIREAFTASVIVLFVLVAEVLEHMTVGRGRRAIADLLDLLPRTVVVRRDGGLSDVASDAVGIGDVVVLRPGARVPVDGEVVSGHSFVDQSA